MKTQPINLAIVGCGQMGSRHLQSLAKIDRAVEIFVIDPSETALNMAKERLQECEHNPNIKNVYFNNRIEFLPGKISVAIVATDSNIRRVTVENVVASSQVDNFILEKVLFTKIEDYTTIGRLFNKEGIKAWVNCPRRIYPFYQQLRQKLQSASFFEYRASGSNWGLGCNAIHMLDSVAFLFGRNKIDLFTDQLDSTCIESKRSGYKEFTGTLFGRISNIGVVSLTSHPNGKVPFIIDISTDLLRCIICESSGHAWIAELVNDWKWTVVEFPKMYQSHLTHLAVQQILNTGDCGLTSYEESCALHLQVIEAFLKHINKQHDKEVLSCPIT